MVGGGSPQQVVGFSLLDIYLHGLHVALICTYIIYDIGIGTIIFSKKNALSLESVNIVR